MLVEATREFVQRFRHHRDFALVSDAYNLVSHKRQPLKLLAAVLLFLAMVTVNSLDLLPLATCALAVVFLMFLSGILTVDSFRESIPGMILLTIAGAFGIAKAISSTGMGGVACGNLDVDQSIIILSLCISYQVRHINK